MKKILFELLELCIEKELIFEYSPKHSLVEVYEYDEKSNLIFKGMAMTAGDYYEKELKFSGAIPISKLLENVKNYKK